MLYNLVFGEGVMNDANLLSFSVLFITFGLTHIKGRTTLQLFGNFVYVSDKHCIGIGDGILSPTTLGSGT